MLGQLTIKKFGLIVLEAISKIASLFKAGKSKGEAPVKLAVIGRQMEDLEDRKGLKSFAGYLQKEVGVPVEYFMPSPLAVREWKALLDNLEGNFPSNEVIEASEIFRENMKWADKIRNEGYSVIDNGLDPTYEIKSYFYEMELKKLELTRGVDVF